ncbi:sensor histidine kinase [Amycolatopsis sp. YIM 10]|uniref:sensor histidine kinase n=1 Tax=Amycolatopsis sp. YIM 10 TaxID=2653857 RepID=UPI00129029F7|nr:histidine kinase [Amycolatopsis sp. YIM 10]
MRGIRWRVKGRDQAALESLRRYTRYNIVFTMLAVGSVLLLAEARERPDAVRLAVLVAGLALAGLGHWYWTVRSIDGPIGRMPWWQAGVLTVLAGGLLVAAFGIDGRGAVWALAAGLIGHDLLIGRFPEAGWRFGVGFAALMGLTAAVTMLVSGQSGVPGQAVMTFVLTLLMTYAEVLLLRQWTLTLELEKARLDAAELATTKERLRLAEDLHDILGHALEVVSLKSELASRLSEVDPERSRAELNEVQRLARGAVHDVRALVQGRRSTELVIEMAGARGLLESAGIRWQFTGDPARLGAEAGELLGRVLREAVTNLLRHSDATHCLVRLEIRRDRAVLHVRNDGVAPMREDGREGSGLRGLNRRITEAGGEFSAEPHGNAFEVRAEVPR